MALKKKTIEQILELKQIVLENPHLVYLKQWYGFHKYCLSLTIQRENLCGSVGCLAGLKVALSNPEGLTLELEDALNRKNRFYIHCKEGGIYAEAKKLFGFSEEQAQSFFFSDNWPPALRERVEQFEGGVVLNDPEKEDPFIILEDKRTLQDKMSYAVTIAEAMDRFIACGGDWHNDY